MKKVLVVLIIGLFFAACGEKAEPLKPLSKGMPNTVELPNGNLVYDIDGEWNAAIYIPLIQDDEDILKITQDGNKFVGIKLIGNQWSGPGTEIIKGELEKNGFKSLSMNVVSEQGWQPANAKISENCNKIITKTHLKSQGLNLELTLTRK